jgi:NAD(P)-dependent dehydrogenase (short-subunit alcohol dehydrogenase family)
MRTPGRKVLITGGASGIGTGSALGLDGGSVFH